ncbi:MAG TPA: OsmC family protein [Gemmatimonadaceae bacterium]|nr:OsmC family protein [Gemmatimonadaceae bacterium]
MLGTLNGALEARGIKLAPDALSASATGVNELVSGIVRLTSIDVHYRLSIPSGTRDAVDRALARHQEKCPTAVSLAAAIAISWTADITEQRTA